MRTIVCHFLCHLSSAGFTALDATVLAMTEIMWTFVHINHNLVEPVLKYTIRFLLAPVRQYNTIHVHAAVSCLVLAQSSDLMFNFFRFRILKCVSQL